ncbi:hypothetical protein [Rhizobium sp. ZPR3]|uniref:Uncharacterized protein n=2 Tax=unclassified Rhizobium TaxID=2613769 RepID=A0AAU7SRF3_9HYPH
MTDASEKRKFLAKELPDWLSRKERLFRQKPMEWLGDFDPVGKTDVNVKLAPARFERLATWYRREYALSGIGATPDIALLSASTRNDITSYLLEIPIYDFHAENLGRYNFDRYGKLLAQVIATGWKDEAELVARLGFKELNRLMDRGISYGRLPWFMLELAKDWLKADVAIDSEFRQHEVANLGVWDKLLAGWRDPNERSFDALMSEMAEYHLAQSEIVENTEKDWYEFEELSYWLFPVELLAVLRLREWAGIANPPLTHPIFWVTPLANLYPSPAWPKDETVDRAEAKFRALYPDTPSVADLPRLRKEQ